MFSFTQRLAYRQLRAPQKGSFVPFASTLAVVGLSVGIAALIITFSALQGFEDTVSRKIAGFDGHIRIQHYFNQPVNLTGYPGDSVKQFLDHPFDSYHYVEAPVLVRKGQKTEGALLLGLGTDSIGQLDKILTGGTVHFTNSAVIIGDRLAELLGVSIGEELILVDFNSFNSLGSATRLKSYTVIGQFHSGLYEYDKSLIYMPLKDAQNLLGMENSIHGEVFFLRDSDFAKVFENTLTENLDYPYFVTTWKEKHQVLFDWMNLQKWPILAIFGMIAFVGLVNIMSALTMIVLEKIRATGILMATGLRKHSVMNIFFIEGILIGLAGSFLGLLIAFGIIQIQEIFQIIKIPEDIYFMDTIPMKLNSKATLFIIAGSIFSSILAAMIPAIKAKNINPADALRYE